MWFLVKPKFQQSPAFTLYMYLSFWWQHCKLTFWVLAVACASRFLIADRNFDRIKFYFWRSTDTKANISISLTHRWYACGCCLSSNEQMWSQIIQNMWFVSLHCFLFRINCDKYYPMCKPLRQRRRRLDSAPWSKRRKRTEINSVMSSNWMCLCWCR